MKPITDINEMPVLNWYKFHESHQSGKPDWKQLYSDLPKNVNEKEAAIDKLEQLLVEISQMNSHEKKGKRDVYKAIKNFHTEL